MGLSVAANHYPPSCGLLNPCVLPRYTSMAVQ